MYNNPTITVESLLALNTEYSFSLTNKGLISLSGEVGEDLRCAFISGQVLVAGSRYFVIRQNGIWTARNIAAGETVDLYVAKLAGTVPDTVKVETWQGNEQEQELGSPEVISIAVGGEKVQSLSGFGRVSVTTESGEAFRVAFVNGQVTSPASDALYTNVRYRGAWEIDNLDPANTIDLYLGKPDGLQGDYFKIEAWEVV